jgi:hypothetical protein
VDSDSRDVNDLGDSLLSLLGKLNHFGGRTGNNYINTRTLEPGKASRVSAGSYGMRSAWAELETSR